MAMRGAEFDRTEFPILCDTCLGPNPYVRMMKAETDKECKICARPFTVYRWRPGRDARYKKTEVCQTCAKLKNVCQTCLLDLEFGLPVQVRDAVLNKSSALIPQSDVNREWFAEQAEKQMANGQFSEQSIATRQEMRTQLLSIARSQPYFKRNEAHICSFFLKGQCNRGDSCPYRHEIPDKDKDPELSNQNIKDRYHGVSDPVAKKLLSKIGLNKLQTPDDKTIKTLYVGNLDSSITEQDIRDHFYPFGEIKEIKIVSQSNCAFVTYAKREQAEQAADQLYNNLSINGTNLKVSWSIDKSSSSSGKNQQQQQQQQSTSSYFNIPSATASTSYSYNYVPPNPSISKPYYPSMDPNKFGSKRDR